VTTSTSPGSSFSISRPKPFRRAIASELDTVSEITRCGSTANPAAAISKSWFSTVCPKVETRA
jgi:hypothetical protein